MDIALKINSSLFITKIFLSKYPSVGKTEIPTARIHLSKVRLPMVHRQCSQVQACASVGNELLLTLCEGFHPVLWGFEAAERPRDRVRDGPAAFRLSQRQT